MADDIPAAREFWDRAEAKRKALGRCGEQDEDAGCKVALRYIYEIFRNNPKELVFAQALFGFELASADPRVVAINFVGEEDGHDAMTDYEEHMRMVGFLRGLYPRIRVSLHAGELAPGLVPPEGLCCHIRLAVEQAGTERIGHGVDVMYEDHPYELLKTMADKGVLVEINLTSNDIILGISGDRHPFATYRKFGVPVALSTDDAGIERIDLTHEYVRAVADYALTYADLKDIVRNSLDHSFLPGASLWAARATIRASPGNAATTRRAERTVFAMRVLSRSQREGGAGVGIGTAVSGVRSELLSGREAEALAEERSIFPLSPRGRGLPARRAKRGEWREG